MSKVTINGISFDPETQQNQPSLEMIPDTQLTYILLQTKEPLNQENRDRLISNGITILEYVPENSYICHCAGADKQIIEALSFVSWISHYWEGFKAPAYLQSTARVESEPNLFSPLSIETSMSQEPQQLLVVLHKDIQVEDVRTQLATAARLDPEDLQFSNNGIRITIQPQHIEDLVRIDAVRHIELYAEPKLHNNVALDITKSNEVHVKTNLEGEGEIIAICDTGLDKGSTQDVHPSFEGRVRKLYSLGRLRANDPNGHGTHVAGSAVGDGSSNSMGGAIRGTAPKAELVFQSVLDHFGGLGGLPDDLENLFKIPYETDGARIHSNSWGVRNELLFGRYTINAEQIDRFVWENRDCVILFSAGNEGSDRNADGRVDNSSITPPATAKNCITVGATESNRPEQSRPYGSPWPDDFPIDPLAHDAWADDPNGMAAFSSRGPTQNGRIKPDLAAPGTSILSAKSRDAHVGSFWGQSLDPLYAFMGGTSMATPIVAGCAAIVREYYRTQQNISPGAALVKATLINGAIDLVGQYTPTEVEGQPNHAEGFGRVELTNSVGPHAPERQILFKDEATKLDTGEEEEHEITIQTSSILKATLVWIDPPGEALQNDLDLIVRAAAGQELHGNMPVNSNLFDRTNNVEQVIWNNIPIGKATVIVKAHRVTLHPQSYALVIRTDPINRGEDVDEPNAGIEHIDIQLSGAGPDELQTNISFHLTENVAPDESENDSQYRIQINLTGEALEASQKLTAEVEGRLVTGKRVYEEENILFPITSGIYTLSCRIGLKIGTATIDTEESTTFCVKYKDSDSP